MPSSLHQSKTNAAHAVTSFNSNANKRPKYFLLLLLPFFAILAQAPFVAVRGQTILLLQLQPNTICSSSDPSEVAIISLLSGFASGTVFNAELSDINGSFASPTVIGTGMNDQGVNKVGIVALIPGNLPPSAGYLIRVVSGTVISSRDLNFTLRAESGPTAIKLLTQDPNGCNTTVDDGVITASATGGSGSYTWTAQRLIPGPRTDVPIDANGTASNLGEGTYAIVANDATSNCKILGTDTLVRRLPVIEVSTQGNVSACDPTPPGPGFFTVRVGVGDGRDGIYSRVLKPWTFTLNTDAPVVKTAPVTFDNLAEGPYQVSMTDGAGCSSNLITGIVIGKDAPLVITLSGWGNPTCGQTNGDITVLNSGGSQSTYRYSISKDGGAFSPFQSGRRFGGLGAGTYTVEGMDSRGCTATLVQTLSNPKGCALAATGSTGDLNSTAKNALGIQVFPNPTRTSFTLNLQSSSKENVQIIVTDMVGKKLYQTTGSGSRQYTFGSEFSSGVYIVQVIQGKQIQTLKLVKGN